MAKTWKEHPRGNGVSMTEVEKAERIVMGFRVVLVLVAIAGAGLLLAFVPLNILAWVFGTAAVLVLTYGVGAAIGVGLYSVDKARKTINKARDIGVS